MTPKDLREMARTLLDLADAYEAGKVKDTKDPYVRHYSLLRRLGGFLLNDEDADRNKVLMQEIPHRTCQHDLTKWAMFIVGARCRLTDEFFINEKLSKLLCEQMHYLTP